MKIVKPVATGLALGMLKFDPTQPEQGHPIESNSEPINSILYLPAAGLVGVTASTTFSASFTTTQK